MSIARVTALILLVGVTIWLTLRTKSAIDFRSNYLEGTEAEKIVEFQGVRMQQGEFILHYVVPRQVNPFAAALVRQSALTLWLLLYGLYGFIGNYIYYLTGIVRAERSQSNRARAAAQFAARTMLAGLCGLVSLLLIEAVAGPLGEAVGSWIPGKVKLPGNAVRDGFLFLPILAGIFVGTFYEHMEAILTTTLERIKRTLAGGK